MYEAQISFVLAGTDNTRWVAYCFTKNLIDETSDDETSDDEDSDDGDSDDDVPDGECEKREFESMTQGIWDPRSYFLKILRLRMNLVLREWTFLIRKVDIDFAEYVRQQSLCTFSE